MNKIEGMLGFAAKAGALVYGTTAVENALKKGQLKLVILAEDLSPRTIKHFTHICEVFKVNFFCLGSRAELGRWIGKPDRGVIGLTSSQFSKTIYLLFKDGGDHHK